MLNWNVLNWFVLNLIVLNWIALIKLDCIELNRVKLDCVELNCVELNCVKLNCVKLNCVKLNGVKLDCVELNLNWIELNDTYVISIETLGFLNLEWDAAKSYFYMLMTIICAFILQAHINILSSQLAETGLSGSNAKTKVSKAMSWGGKCTLKFGGRTLLSPAMLIQNDIHNSITTVFLTFG